MQSLPNLQNILDLLKQNNFSVALKECESALQIAPQDPLLQFAQVLCLDGMGLRDLAISIAQNHIKSNPNNPQLQDYLNTRSATNTPTNTASNSTNGAVASIKQNFYGTVLLNPQTLAKIATSAETWQSILSFHKVLATDDYVSYLDTWYNECFSRFGKNWVYLDIVNVLFAASSTLKPRNYLEIGVRRGRSVCTVAKATPSVNIFAFDMWQVNYAGMENPGPAFVQSELSKIGHTGSIQFINGNSHQTLPDFFAKNPGIKLDMITVDGDHSDDGALQDLLDVIPHLSVGGVLIFDDIAHPSHTYLLNVWKKAMSKHPELSSYEFVESGYGVAFAIKNK